MFDKLFVLILKFSIVVLQKYPDYTLISELRKLTYNGLQIREVKKS